MDGLRASTAVGFMAQQKAKKATRIEDLMGIDNMLDTLQRQKESLL